MSTEKIRLAKLKEEQARKVCLFNNRLSLFIYPSDDIITLWHHINSLSTLLFCFLSAHESQELLTLLSQSNLSRWIKIMSIIFQVLMNYYKMHLVHVTKFQIKFDNLNSEYISIHSWEGWSTCIILNKSFFSHTELIELHGLLHKSHMLYFLFNFLINCSFMYSRCGKQLHRPWRMRKQSSRSYVMTWANWYISLLNLYMNGFC